MNLLDGLNKIRFYEFARTFVHNHESNSMHFLPRSNALRISFLPTLIVVALATNQAGAGFILVDSRAELRGNDFVDWGQLGSLGTEVSTRSSTGLPTPLTTNQGLNATLTSGGGFQDFSDVIIDEHLGTPSLQLETKSFFGNFISDPGVHALVDVRFDTPVEAVGADVLARVFLENPPPSGIHGQIGVQVWEPAARNSSFSANVLNIDETAPLIDGLYTVSQFAGVQSDAGANIGRVRFLVSAPTPNGLNFLGMEVNQVDLAHSAASPVPEPSSLVLFGVGLFSCAAFGALRYCRNSNDGSE